MPTCLRLPTAASRPGTLSWWPAAGAGRRSRSPARPAWAPAPRSSTGSPRSWPGGRPEADRCPSAVRLDAVLGDGADRPEIAVLGHPERVGRAPPIAPLRAPRPRAPLLLHALVVLARIVADDRVLPVLQRMLIAVVPVQEEDDATTHEAEEQDD